MARSNKKKLSTEASQDPLGGLGEALDGLDLGSLPEGPNDAKPQKKEPKRRVILRRETAHRGGKTVTIVGGMEPPVSEQRRNELAKQLRQHCGCGGAVKAGEIELQGEQAGAARRYLEKEGFRVDGVR